MLVKILSKFSIHEKVYFQWLSKCYATFNAEILRIINHFEHWNLTLVAYVNKYTNNVCSLLKLKSVFLNSWRLREIHAICFTDRKVSRPKIPTMPSKLTMNESISPWKLITLDFLLPIRTTEDTLVFLCKKTHI